MSEFEQRKQIINADTRLVLEAGIAAMREYGYDPNTLPEINWFRDSLVAAISKGVPIHFQHSNRHLGDHLILRSAISLVLQEFAKSRSIDPESVKLSLSKEEKHSSVPRFDLSRHLSLIGGTRPQAYESAINSFYLSRIAWLSDYVGINPLDQDYHWLYSPPIPLQCDFQDTPMSRFSLAMVAEQTEQLQTQIDPDSHYCIIMHGGSQSVKRFGLDQVRNIEKALRVLYPKSKFAILTAQAIDKNGGPPITAGDADLVVDAVLDINRTAALFLAPKNVTFVGTDTFLAWLAAGMISSREDRGGVLRPRDMYVLNTVATKSFWGITGANHTESEALEAIRREQQRLTTAADNMISPQEYLEYYRSDPDTHHNVHPIDLAKFLLAFVSRNS